MTTSPASWRNRQRCGAWPRWSRVAWHRRRCSQPSRRRSASSSTSTARTWVATSRTARQPPLRAGPREATSSHSAPGSRSTTTVSSPGCCAPVGPNAWTTTRTCPARSPRPRGHSAFAARLESRLRSKAASGASWPSPRDRTSRCPRIPRTERQPSPSSSVPRSPTARHGPRSPASARRKPRCDVSRRWPRAGRRRTTCSRRSRRRWACFWASSTRACSGSTARRPPPSSRTGAPARRTA